MECLENYQKEAVNFILEKKKCCLFLSMGMGKTLITLTAIKELLQSNKIKRVLVVAPLRVCNTVWQQEINKWEHLRGLTCSVATGSEVQRLSAVESKANITIINRENVAWLVKATKWQWDMVVIDESSSFKNYASIRFKALKAVTKYVKYHVNLTGTPIPNGYKDIWSQIYLCDNGERLGRNITQFRQNFFYQAGYNGYEYFLQPDAENKIKILISDICLSMNVSDYIDLPNKIEIIEKLSLSDALFANYKKLEKDFVLSINDNNIIASTAAIKGNKLLQFCNGAIYDNDNNTHDIHNVKIDYLRDILEDNPSENILVAYNYKSDVVKLKKAFPDAVILGKNEKDVEAWNNGKVRLLLAHPLSAAHGLNLQFGGNIIVWFGMTWNLENYEQFNARLLRRGQKNTVRIIHLLINNSIECNVYNAVSIHKAKTQNELLNYLKKVTT